MKYKTLLTICLIACVLFTISSVNAIDVNETVIANDDIQEIIQETNDERLIENNDYDTLTTINQDVLQESKTIYVDKSSQSTTEDGSQNNPYKTLKIAYDSANDGDTINIASGTYSGPENLFFEMSNKGKVTIQGNGNVIFDGNGGYYTTNKYGEEVNPSMFTIHDIGTTFKGITFINGHVSGNGAILGIYANDCIVDNCKFIDNSAGGKGGAIYIYNSGTDLWGYNIKISNCEFENNIAYEGGAIYWDGNNGQLSSSIFKYNMATVLGDSIYWKGENGLLTNCKSYTKSSEENNLYISSGSTKQTNFKIYVPATIKVSSLTKIYGTSTKLTINLMDKYGNKVRSADIDVNLNGVKKTITTDNNGKAQLDINLVPGTYSATISYIDNKATVKVIVKKATPKIIASAKTFKKSVKTKKYTITLKNNLNKVMKNTKVTIKVNKKTYTAKTNSNGKATFKITKLTKKGTYKTTITYKGSSIYNKVTKTIKIKCK